MKRNCAHEIMTRHAGNRRYSSALPRSGCDLIPLPYTCRRIHSTKPRALVLEHLLSFSATPIDAQAADMDTFSNPLGIDTDHVRYASDRITPKA